MIVTITLNPAIDRTLILSDALEVGELNIVSESYVEIGGKGINVSRAIRSLGGQSEAMGFAAGANGRTLKEGLMSYGIHHDFIDIPGETRVNIQVVTPSGEHTDINEPGAKISDADYLRLIERIKRYLDPSNLFVISGRMPPGMSGKQYMKLIRIIKKKGCPLFVDCGGQLLSRVLEADYKPEFIKPNSTELAAATGRPKTKDPEEALIGAMELHQRGVRFVCASLGDNGAVFVCENEQPLYITTPLNLSTSSAVGSGDAMIGAIVHAYNQGMCYEEIAKFAVAMGTASARLPGSQMATMKEAFEIYETLQVYTM